MYCPNPIPYYHSHPTSPPSPFHFYSNIQIGPGPTYALPPTIGYEKHHLGKHRGPQYSIGARLNPIEKNLTPGPALNLENKTRYGNKPTYAYSIASRLDKKCTMISFSFHSILHLISSHLSYFLHLSRLAVKSVGPGPAGYAVNAKRCVDSSCPPAYSIAARDKFQFKQSSPGPMAYSIKDNVVMPTSPAYSM